MAILAVTLVASSVSAAWMMTHDEVTLEQAASTRPQPAAAPTAAPRETSLWPAKTRVKAATHADRTPVELGTRFVPARNGWATGVRFYKARGEKGRHTGSLWDSKGRRLAQVTFAGESRSGWQEARFATPVPLRAHRHYTISYHSDNGTYVGSRGFTPVHSGPLATVRRNAGVFGYGDGVFPRHWHPRGYNYWADVVFRWRPQPQRPGTTAAPEPSPPASETEEPEPEPSIPGSTEPAEPVPSTSGGPSTTPTPTPTSSHTATPTPSRTATPTPGATSTPSPGGNHTPRPTPTATPTEAPSPGGDCAYPTPSCTGVPAGTKLTALALNEDNAAYRVTTPGAVLDRVHIPGDLLIHADGVKITNSRIDGTVVNADGPRTFRFTITDSTVGPASGCETLPGIGQDKYTAVRVHIRNHGDGFRAAGDDVVIRDSYVRLCSNPGDHSDGIQTYQTGRNLVFDHNTVDQRYAKDVTAPIFLTDDQIVNATVTDNLVMGGTYSIQVKNGQGRLVVRDNKLVDKSWIYGPVEADCDKIDWAGNTLVTIDANYRVTSTVGPLNCVPR